MSINIIIIPIGVLPENSIFGFPVVASVLAHTVFTAKITYFSSSLCFFKLGELKRLKALEEENWRKD